MKKKDKRVMQILFFILLVMCLIYIGIDQYKIYKGKQEAAKTTSNYILEESDIQSITYNNGQEKLSFIKQNDSWHYAAELEVPLKQTKLSEFENAINHLAYVRELKDADGLAAYGLDHPANKITFTDKNNKETVLNIGNQIGSNYYLYVDDPQKIYTVDNTLVTYASSSLLDLVDYKNLPALTKDQVQSVEIEFEGRKLSYENKGNTANSAETKSAENTNETSDIFTKIISLSLNACSDYKLEEAEKIKYGLNKPTMVLRVKYNDGQEQAYTLTVGSLNEDNKYYYAVYNDTNMVTDIDAEDINAVIQIVKE